MFVFGIKMLWEEGGEEEETQVFTWMTVQFNAFGAPGTR